MSSSLPPSLPIINSIAASPTTTPGKTPQPPAPGDNITSSTRPSERSTQTTLLLTPPISEPQPRQDRGGYFSSRGSRSGSRNNRTASPGTRSIPPLSPGLSSGGSYQSSDTGQSPCSYSSGEFLSPPQFQVDGDKPPYVPRQSSFESLSMVKMKMRRVKTIPNNKKIKVRRRHRRDHRCEHHKSKRQEQHAASCWGESTCQVAPTAPKGGKELCRYHAGNFVPRSTQYGNTDTFGRLMPQDMPGPAPPVVTRRWSSVEAGAHQVVLKAMLSHGLPKASNTRGSVDGDDKDKFVSTELNHRFRSSSFTRGAIDHDIVREVRERLAVRKVVTHQLENPLDPPLSITLRRASSGSQLDHAKTDRNTFSAEGSGVESPLADTQHDPQNRQQSAAYLITSEDIESITLLIAENLARNLDPYNRNKVLDEASSTAHSSYSTRTPTIAMGATPSNPITAEPRISVKDFQTTAGQASNQNDYLQVNDLKQPIQRSGSTRSEHEVLWNVPRKSTTSFSSSAFEEDQKQSDTPSESEASPGFLPKDHKREPTIDKGGAFDPSNPRASINEWSWRLPQNDITMVVTSSDSDSADIIPKTERKKGKAQPSLRSVASTHKERATTRSRPFPRYAASHEQLQDVVSFPPLAQRKTTSEWFSPLPEMETTSPKSTSSLKASRSLYSLGVDVTAGPSGPAVSKAGFTSWVRSAEVSPSQSPGINFRPEYGFGELSGLNGLSTKQLEVNDRRRKSVIKPHPKATARTGETFAMGSSIGAHTSERRRSSAPRIKRVRTIDNVNKGKRDEPPSRWRPPSICPPRISPSQISSIPAEPEEPDKERQSEERIPEMMTRLHRLRSGITDRISLVEARSPQLPKSDCAGIYGTITGTLRRSIAAPCEDDGLRHECDDCANDPRSPSIDWIG